MWYAMRKKIFQASHDGIIIFGLLMQTVTKILSDKNPPKLICF